jgi:UDP-N-acetylmuramate--alanine ligase
VRLGRVERIHLVGIGGSGMSGIAEVLVNLGYRVSGSDVAASAVTEHLAALGAEVVIGHAPERIAGADVVVVSTAIPADDPERHEAERLRVPIIPRAEMLGELMRMKHAVAVSGSHGKTSTTAMLGAVLSRCGLDPTVVIGGRLGMFGSSAKLGASDLMVAEADESDGSFLRLFPTIAIVTGIDREHLAHYGSEQRLRDAFVDFAARVPFYGAVVACLDDDGVQAILPRLERRVVTYGLTAQADFRAEEIRSDGFSVRFTARHAGLAATVELATPGRHQVQNALAALAAAHELGVETERAAEALGGFTGADRRLEQKGRAGGVLVVDDYGHHPREIVVTLAALREAVPGRRLVTLFQPHRHSRLADLFDEFAASFHETDALVVTDVYGAGEPGDPRAGAERLARAVADRGHRNVCYGGDLDAAIATTAELVQSDDVVLTLGAGSVARAGARLLARLETTKGGSQ